MACSVASSVSKQYSPVTLCASVSVIIVAMSFTVYSSVLLFSVLLLYQCLLFYCRSALEIKFDIVIMCLAECKLRVMLTL